MVEAAAPGAAEEEEAEGRVPLGRLLSTILSEVAEAGEAKRANEHELRALQCFFPQAREAVFDSRARLPVPGPETSGMLWRWMAARPTSEEEFAW